MSHSYWGIASQRPTLQEGFYKDSSSLRPAMLNLFCIPEYHISFSCHDSLISDLCQLLSLSLFFMILTVLRSTEQISRRLFLNLGLSDGFFML